jgi:hypothetical protein
MRGFICNTQAKAEGCESFFGFDTSHGNMIGGLQATYGTTISSGRS